MPVYEYKATDSEGKKVSGTVLSASIAKAADELGKRGLSVEHVTLATAGYDPIAEAPAQREAPPPPTTTRSALITEVVGPLAMRVPLDQTLFFFRQLSTMLSAGVPIVSSLETLARQARDPRLKPIIQEIEGHVRAGRPMSVGMQRYPEVFTPLQLSLIRAGEEGGMLDKALKQMATYVEQEIQLRNMIRKATLYPKVIVGASILIVLGANYIIRDVFGKPGGLSTPLTDPATWLILGPLIVFLFLFFRVGVTNPRLRHNYSAVLLAIPAIGGTLHQMAMAKFARAFAALYNAGVPMNKALELSADACGSEYLRSKMYKGAPILEEGRGITEALASTGAFTQTVLDMTQTGETTGQIDEMLDKVADYYEDDSQVRANQLAIILGVVCFLAVAAYVAFIVISFYTGHVANYGQGGDAG